jgi:hypothetical protein
MLKSELLEMVLLFFTGELLAAFPKMMWKKQRKGYDCGIQVKGYNDILKKEMLSNRTMR